MQENKHVYQFRVHLQRLGYSTTSISMLPSCLKEFLVFTQKKVHQIQSKDITHYYHYLQERPNKRRSGGLSETFIHHHIYSLKLFFGWLEERGAITINPISGLSFPTPTAKARELLTQSEIKTLYGVTESLKEKAVLSLFYGCGLRRSEGVKLNISDIHFKAQLLHVREGKGKKRRSVPMSEAVANDLKAYIYKERYGREEEKAVITNLRGSRTSGGSYNALLKKILERTPIEKQITLHCLRHSIATHLLEQGLKVENVRDFLGHQHLESTQIYTRVNQNQLWSLASI